MSRITARDDLLHTPPNDHYTWTETNWFGLMFVPEKGLQFDIYVWLHPNLKVAYAGLYVSRGIKKDQLAAEYWDFRSWLPFPEGDLDDYRLDNGLSIKILKPLTTYQLDYVDEARKTEVHVLWDAIMPPVPFPMGEHLEQAGRVTGRLVLDGEVHEVDCYAIRDHSWVFRPETPKLGRRPIAMINCGYDDGLAFCVTLPDLAYQRDSNSVEAPGWLTQAAAPDGGMVPFCWVHRDDVTRQIKSASQRTIRADDGFHPVRVEAEFVDDRDERYVVTGEIRNFLPFHWMQNNMISCCMTRFDCNGRQGWGNFSESLECDVVRRLLK
jgi:hypothetical protein